MIDEGWHYPRSEIVERVYTALAYGPTKGLTLFGPRQTGKTEFLVKDLAPYAEERGHVVVFVDFWKKENKSLVALLQALDQAQRGVSFLERMKTAIESIASKIRIKSPDGTVELEIRADSLKDEMPDELLLLMEEYLNRLAKMDRPTFLLFDEFQEINKAPYAEDLVASLRSIINRQRDRLITVFSGSSQDELRKMFNDRTAPFFAYANGYNLPELDEDFVDHQLDYFRSLSRVDVERSAALDVFHRFNGNPMILQRWLMHLLLYPKMDHEEALAETLETAAGLLGYRRTWTEISTAERVASRLLADRLTIYGDDGKKNSRKLTGWHENAEDELVTAVDRLLDLGVAVRNNGDCIIGDELFRYWIRNRPNTEF